MGSDFTCLKGQVEGRCKLQPWSDQLLMDQSWEGGDSGSPVWTQLEEQKESVPHPPKCILSLPLRASACSPSRTLRCSFSFSPSSSSLSFSTCGRRVQSRMRLSRFRAASLIHSPTLEPFGGWWSESYPLIGVMGMTCAQRGHKAAKT